ncbi:hypothetical protein H2248_003658 [Termitomyces sp. 'cryptogamus']|nr:hypothetical protein H2248_003658 [Termitomyces sp. 'cryptogamus']
MSVFKAYKEPPDRPRVDQAGGLIPSPSKKINGQKRVREADIFDEPTPRTPTRNAKKHNTSGEGRMRDDEDEMDIQTEDSDMDDWRPIPEGMQWSQRTQELAHAISTKILPKIEEAGEKVASVEEADSSMINQKFDAVTESIESLAKVVQKLESCLEAKPRQTGEEQGGRTQAQGANNVFATGPTYKPSKNKTTQLPPVKPKHTPRSPLESHHPARLIVIPRGEKIDSTVLTPCRIVTLINNRLTDHEESRHLRVASAS